MPGGPTSTTFYLCISSVHECAAGQLKCDNGQKCFPAHMKCDGNPACFDWSDERECGNVLHTIEYVHVGICVRI